MNTRIRVDTNTMPWENGLDVVRSMAPEFKANLGPAELVEELYVKYNQKTLRIDPVTSRRLDLIWIEGGYRDLTNAYHDSVEECLVLDGELDLDGEGHFVAGDYFWRPPGFVHAAETAAGFTAVLIQHGKNEMDASGPASRRIRPDEEAGTNALLPDDLNRAIGPRGWVLRLPTSLVPWQQGPVFARGEAEVSGADLDNLAVKVLSKNPSNGAQSLLVRLDPGYAQAGPGRSSTSWEFYVLDGVCAVGDDTYQAGTYGYFAADAVVPPMRSEAGATLFAKLDGRMERLPA